MYLLNSVSYESMKPGILFLAAASLTTIALHFPTRHHRFFLLPAWFLIAWSLVSVNGDNASEGLIGLNSYIAITCIISILVLPQILLFQNHSLLVGAKTPTNPEAPGWFIIPASRVSIAAAYRIWNNPRHLSLQRPGSGSASWPELLKFALFRIFKAGIIIFIDRVLLQKIRLYLTASSTLFDFTPDQEPILRRLLENDEDDPVSQHQLILRAFMCVSWMWANFLILESYHAVLSIVFVVVLRLDDPEDWPPLFGSPAEAWTVRRFWGKFWHRLPTPTFAVWAQLVSRRLLGQKPGSGVDKAVVAFGIFFLSGLAHAIAAWRVGEGDAHRDVLFFCANFVVVGVEILATSLAKNSVRKTKYEVFLRNRRMQAAGKILGYIWVFAWFFWAAPRWLYSKTLRWSLKQAILQSSRV
ncbi:membrane bound O-acyl transferase family-domain-containing protein [Hypomontagnella submonticulosa]|nr:membrane bound O-acyl transferase family-domain-containing protein [Hypomontagnella submonticulosa]